MSKRRIAGMFERGPRRARRLVRRMSYVRRLQATIVTIAVLVVLVLVAIPKTYRFAAGILSDPVNVPDTPSISPGE